MQAKRPSTSSLVAAAVTVALVLGVPATAAGMPADDRGREHGSLVVYGRGGAAGEAPLNTRAAFEKALAQDVDYISTTVRMTADGHLVAFHDRSLANHTDVESVYPGRAPWHVGDFTLAEIKRLDAGSWFAPRFAGQRILTFAELFDLVHGQAGVFLELRQPGFYPGIVDALAETVKRHPSWLAARGRGRFGLVINGFREAWDSLRALHRRMPELPVAARTWGFVPDDAALDEIASWAGTFATNLNFLAASEAARIEGAGLALVPYTVDARDYILQSIQMDASGVVTDYPRVVRAVTRGEDALPSSDVVISSIHFNVSGGDAQPENGEYVLLRNRGDDLIEVGGWFLRDQAGNRLAIGEGYAIEPGDALRVYTGPGTNRPGRFYNGHERSVLNNSGGDAVALHRSGGGGSGGIVDIDQYLVG